MALPTGLGEENTASFSQVRPTTVFAASSSLPDFQSGELPIPRHTRAVADVGLLDEEVQGYGGTSRGWWGPGQTPQSADLWASESGARHWARGRNSLESFFLFSPKNLF
jgi:hypothetical protein